MPKRPVIVTTAHRALFFGYTEDESSATVVTLTNARCGIRWNTTGGFLELASAGPNSGSRIGARAPEITLQGVTSVTACSDGACAAWEQAK